MPTQLKSTVILGGTDLNLLLTALHNRMTHHGRAEARLKIGPGGWHHTLCERYRALWQLVGESDQVMVLASDGVGIDPEPVLPEPEPDPESFEPSEEVEQGLPS
jgi:hypothetical protein